MRFRGGGPTGMQITCFRCHGTGANGDPVCDHRDETTRRPCGRRTTDQAVLYARRMNRPLACGHPPDAIKAAVPCGLCGGSGLVPFTRQ